MYIKVCCLHNNILSLKTKYTVLSKKINIETIVSTLFLDTEYCCVYTLFVYSFPEIIHRRVCASDHDSINEFSYTTENTYITQENCTVAMILSSLTNEIKEF